MSVSRQCPKRLVDDAVVQTETTQRAVIPRTGVKPVLHHGGLDNCALVDGLQGWEVDVGNSKAADWVRDVCF